MGIFSFQKTLKEDENFLTNKVREYFIDNSHQLILEMSPKVFIFSFDFNIILLYLYSFSSLSFWRCILSAYVASLLLTQSH